MNSQPTTFLFFILLLLPSGLTNLMVFFLFFNEIFPSKAGIVCEQNIKLE